jgi:twitching motility protein PilU
MVQLKAVAAAAADDAGQIVRTWLRRMAAADASDLFLTTGALPTLKVEGALVPLSDRPLAPGQVAALAQAVLNREQSRRFQEERECDLALALDGIGRFRFNLYVQRGEVSMVVRHVRSRVPSLAELGLPPVLERLALLRQGLVLVVGAAGAGKSTTLAALLDHRNQALPGHILTVEDPIEYVLPHRCGIVDQREVGIDTRSFGDALRHALREAPDVIMIGEIRDEETMRHALHYAQTGHLCVSTLHANSANQAIERIRHFFPDTQQRQVLLDLSLNLQAVVGLRLLEGRDGRRVPATEVLLKTPYVSELILKGQVDELKAVIAKSTQAGMHTFDQALHDLYRSGRIRLQQALEHADSRTDLALRVRLAEGAGPPALREGAPALRRSA